jgi:hypothetical protein
MEVSGQLHVPAALPPPPYPLDRRLVGAQSRSELCGEDKNLAPAESRTPAVQLVAYRYTAIPSECYKYLLYDVQI